MTRERDVRLGVLDQKGPSFGVIRTIDELRAYAATEAREPAPHEEFRLQLAKALAHMPEGQVRTSGFVSLAPGLSTWLDSRIVCRAIEPVTLCSDGVMPLPGDYARR